jgi:hypothetical protein
MFEQRDPAALLERLRQQHIEDRPSEARRRRLLESISANHEQELQYSRPQQPLGAKVLSVAPWALAAMAIFCAGYFWRAPPSIEAEPAISQRSMVPPRKAPNPPCVRAVGNDGLIADFEHAVSEHTDTAPVLHQRDGRVGRWFHRRNTTGDMIQPEPLRIVDHPEATEANRRALRIAGPPPVGWGANAGIELQRCYDASAYAGIEFRARGSGVIFVGFQTVASVPLEFGGNCTTKCWFTAGRYFALSDQFATHRISWQDLSSPEPDYDVSKELLQLTFSVQSGSKPYEFYLDDLRFIPKEASQGLK